MTPLPAVVEEALGALTASWWGRVRYNLPNGAPWRLPVSSPYGYRWDPYYKRNALHGGIDIPLPVGTPVLSAFDGDVDRVDTDGEGRGVANGNAVIVRSAVYWRFCYLHLSRAVVRPGQAVQRGELLGYTGSTGASTGPHLHFQVYVLGQTVDPTVLYPGDLFFRR